jgi:hypothetical protein
VSFSVLKKTEGKKLRKFTRKKKKKKLTGRNPEAPGHHRLRVVELARRAEAAPEMPRETGAEIRRGERKEEGERERGRGREKGERPCPDPEEKKKKKRGKVHSGGRGLTRRRAVPRASGAAPAR